MNKADNILKKYWGYDSFRPLQREIIDSVCEGKDTLALLPTGGGKSITYWVSAMAMDGICIVVTPLISLMKDQVDSLRQKNIKALCVHSGMSNLQIDATLDNAVYGNYKFLYISPERAKTKIFRERFAKMNVCLLAIDEAHCISQWGYDFRPNYLLLAELRTIHPEVNVLAVTASATESVCKDIIDKLNMVETSVFKKSFARHNLSYVMRYTEDKENHLMKIIDTISGIGIVYCRLRKECERVAEFLREKGYKASAYHGGMSYEMRTSVQEEWLSEKTPIIVATNAFGMGIDKSNVRFVVHFDMPQSIEAYYQEAGRAGRDEQEAFAVLLYDDKTPQSVQQCLVSSYPPINKIKEIYNKIYSFFNLSEGEGKGERFDFDINKFCFQYSEFSATVMSSIEILQLNDYMYLSEPSDNPTRIMFKVSRDELYNIQISQNHLNKFIQSILRLYSGVFSFFVKIDESYISKVTGYTLEYISECFKELGRMRIINYIPRKRASILFFNEERLEEMNLRIAPETYILRKELSESKLQKMLQLISSDIQCRSKHIQEYFGEKNVSDCGKCDICRAKNKKSSAQDTIIKILRNEELDLQQIVSRSNLSSTQVEESISKLLLSGSVEVVRGFMYRLK